MHKINSCYSPFALPLVVSVGVGDLPSSAEVVLQVLKTKYSVTTDQLIHSMSKRFLYKGWPPMHQALVFQFILTKLDKYQKSYAT